jgi:hypothetical protein
MVTNIFHLLHIYTYDYIPTYLQALQLVAAAGADQQEQLASRKTLQKRTLSVKEEVLLPKYLSE